MAKPRTPPGPGVDATGQAVIDPTRNVLDLVKAAIERQDDLRKAEARAVHAEIAQLRFVANLREKQAARLRRAESKRINAIRAVDVAAASTLAAQVTATAEALRVQVAAAQSAAVTSLNAALEPIQKDIREVRDKQSLQQGGKEQVTEGRAGIGQLWLIVAGVVGVAGLFLATVSTALAVYALTR
jgi:hypothetical protein